LNWKNPGVASRTWKVYALNSKLRTRSWRFTKIVNPDLNCKRFLNFINSGRGHRKNKECWATREGTRIRGHDGSWVYEKCEFKYWKNYWWQQGSKQWIIHWSHFKIMHFLITRGEICMQNVHFAYLCCIIYCRFLCIFHILKLFGIFWQIFRKNFFSEN